MAEYIEREAAISYIKENQCKKCSDIGFCGNCAVLSAIKLFKLIPAADVQPVVLCRECKWTKTDEMDNPAIYCMKWDRWEMPPNGFCWLGQKRGDRR